MPRLLALGYALSEEAAQAQADVVLRLKTAIASAHMNVVDARDADKLNNPFVWADFIDSAPGFAWAAALAGAQMPLDGSSDVIVMQPHALREAARLWAVTPLAGLKAYTRWLILRARATFLTEEIDRANFDFYGKALRGTAQQRERRKRGVAAFEERTRALVAQYDAYVPAELGPDGPHVNGRLTLGENIGDLGGLSIALKAYEIALEREGKTLDDADVIDGHTAAQRFFLSYARSWREKMRREFLETTVATDEHPPSEFRANGVVKNIDAFAEAFGLQPGDALYLPPEERVRIWQARPSLISARLASAASPPRAANAARLTSKANVVCVASRTQTLCASRVGRAPNSPGQTGSGTLLSCPTKPLPASSTARTPLSECKTTCSAQ